MDKLVLVENSWNMEIEDFMLNATRKQKKNVFPPQKNDCMWINASLKSSLKVLHLFEMHY